MAVPSLTDPMFTTDAVGPIRWKISAAWARRQHDCTIGGITRRCHAGCCNSTTYWPSRAAGRADGRCAWLGPTGCTMTPEQRPVTCLLYPLRVNPSGTLILHQRATTRHGICKGNHGNGPPIIEALRGQLTVLFGPDQYERAAAAVLAGQDAWVDVPAWVIAAMEQEAAWEAANVIPEPRKETSA